MVGNDHLELICSKLLELLHKHNYQPTPGLSSLWGAGATLCIKNEAEKGRSMLCFWEKVIFIWVKCLLRVGAPLSLTLDPEKQGIVAQLSTAA